MCKILVVPKVTGKTRVAALAFMEKMKPLMSTGNKDGLGYAAVDSQGRLFGQRWHTNAASYTKVVEDKAKAMLSEFSDTFYYIPTEGKKNTFGEVNLEDMTALTMHTRFATSGKSFENTHPFVYDDADTSLIHNGVISNTSDFKFKVSSCDSESILISYLKESVGSGGLSKIQGMADLLQGYYACGVFSRDAEGNRILDVFKGNTASLYGLYIQELDTTVFCTSKDDLYAACDSLGFTYANVWSLKEGVAFRFDATGEVVEKTTFRPKERWSYYGSSTTTPNVYDATKAANKGPTFENKTKTTTLTEEEKEYMMLPPGIKRLMDYKTPKNA